MGKTLDYRWSEANFRRYEGVLTAFVANFPHDFYIHPFPFSTSTVHCRMADAVRAFIHNRWPSSCDPEMLKDIWPRVCFSRTSDNVHLVLHLVNRPYGKEITAETIIHRIDESGGDIIKPSTPSGLTISNPSLNVIRALLVLHDENHIPIQTKLTDLTPDAATYIKTQQEFMNIGHMFLDPVTVIIT